MEHRYRIHDKVELNRMAFSVRPSGAEVYEIIRLMPADVSGEYSYRVKAGAIERAVKESEIRGRSGAVPPGEGEAFRR